MATCPACSADVPASGRFCLHCGRPLTPMAMMEPAVAGPYALNAESPTITGKPPSSAPSAPSSEGRFVPGTMLANRYRIVGRLGQGGMGEVYRADDLKLGQPVALKFLPDHLQRDSSMLARFHHEVKIARQVSHPNVCRVYDIAEADGLHFISMEFVDGEDLRSLLRRIGRLPEDKALQIARQMCAGLAAAHDKGVLHRDLKPANVMLDDEGRARITDFGLAAIAGEVTGADVFAGTPAYMAPEQLAGKDVSVASDIYALGLVLFELFTGKPAFRADSLSALLRLQESGVTPPSAHVPGLDRVVERVILACVARHPAERPSSALAVAASLPGGDPLAAALAAGETPSPEVVAASAVTGGLNSKAALASLAGVIVGLIVLVWFGTAASYVSRVPLQKDPRALTIEAQDLLGRIGYRDTPRDYIWGLEENTALLTTLGTSRDPARWSSLGDGVRSPILFFYRQSPRPLVPIAPASYRMKLEDPPATFPGTATVWTDMAGRLIRLEVIPPERHESIAASSRDADWTPLFAAAGLDRATLQPVEAIWNPPFFSDTRLAWQTKTEGTGGAGLRVEAAAYAGRPTLFRVIAPWDKPAEGDAEPGSTTSRLSSTIGISVAVLVVAGALLLARRNVRLGRGDLRGAFRLVSVFVPVHLLAWMFFSKYALQAADEFLAFVATLSVTVFEGLVIYMCYLALEPFVRRRWPDTIVSWTRALAGRLRDPLVGRDILLGCLIGIGVRTSDAALFAVAQRYGSPSLQGLNLVRLNGTRFLFGEALDLQIHAFTVPLALLILLVLLSMLVRRTWLAASVVVGLMAGLSAISSSGTDFWLNAAESAVAVSALLWCLTRVGLLSTVVLFGVYLILSGMPFTTDLSLWYSSQTVLAVLWTMVLAGFGFHTALAGRPLFSSAWLEE